MQKAILPELKRPCGDSVMGNTLWFITILKEKPWLGFLIGLVFITIMFASKNLVVYFYSRSQAKKEVIAAEAAGKEDSKDT